MTVSEDQHPVQALGPYGAHPALGVRVRLRSPDRGLDDPHVLGANHLVEGTGELRVPISDHEPETFESLPHRKVPGLLGDPRRVGVPHSQDDHRRVAR